MLTALCLGLVIGVGVGILLAPPPAVRVVRFVSVPPAPDQCDPRAEMVVQ